MTQISLDKTGKAHYNVKAVSGCSADGSALGSGPRGREFKSPHSDQKKRPSKRTTSFSGFYEWGRLES